MKIAQVSTSWLRVPPENYGGAEAIVYCLTEGLIDRGHQVTLFAAGDAKTRAELVSCIDKAPGLNIENTVDINLRSRYYKTTILPLLRREKFDLIHWHVSFDLLPYFTAQLAGDIPAIVTFHNYFENTDDIYDSDSTSYNIALSKSFHKQVPLKFFATVYNGIDIQEFKFQPDYTGKNIAWIGRFAPVKGVDTAIKLANVLQEKLSLAGQARDTDYYKKKILPAEAKSKFAELIGPVDGERRSQVIGQSKFFINPIDWEEPFGLVVPEANACGTPVIAYNRGAMSELIEDGLNGFLVKPGDFGGLVEAAEKLYKMPPEEYRQMRQACRRHVEENFTVEKMVDGYEEVYKKVMADNKKGSQS